MTDELTSPKPLPDNAGDDDNGYPDSEARKDNELGNPLPDNAWLVEHLRKICGLNPHRKYLEQAANALEASERENRRLKAETDAYHDAVQLDAVDHAALRTRISELEGLLAKAEPRFGMTTTEHQEWVEAARATLRNRGTANG